VARALGGELGEPILLVRVVRERVRDRERVGAVRRGHERLARIRAVAAEHRSRREDEREDGDRDREQPQPPICAGGSAHPFQTGRRLSRDA
jgi:hypothetical protein